MCTSIFHFEGIPTHFSIREGVEGCYDVLSLLSDRSSRKCFNLFGLDPKSMKPSFLSVMESIEQEVNYIGRLIDSIRFTPDCLAERTKNLLTLQQLCEELVIEVLNTALSSIKHPSFHLDGKEFKVNDITTLFQSCNSALPITLFGTEMNCKASDINGILSAIDSARIVRVTNVDNLNVLESVYTHAKYQLVSAGIESYTPSSGCKGGGQELTEKAGFTTSGKIEEALHYVVSALPAILKGAADFLLNCLIG